MILRFIRSKNKDNSQVNTAKQNNKVKGGININAGGGVSPVETIILNKLDKIETKLDKVVKHADSNSVEIDKIKRGLNFYIQNNGVEKHVKEAANEMLK